jgi:hypothetical protein
MLAALCHTTMDLDGKSVCVTCPSLRPQQMSLIGDFNSFATTINSHFRSNPEKNRSYRKIS